MSAWPPPPDVESVRELVRAADVEGFLAEGAAGDEYEGEEEEIFAAIRGWATHEITAGRLMPVLEGVWAKSFALDGEELGQRRPALEGLAGQIARFFGPEAQPRTRQQS